MRRNAAIAIIFNNDISEVLLVKRHDVPVWVLPGGGVDEGELSEQAVIREAHEETGLTVKIIRKVAEYTAVNRLARYTETFECHPIEGQLQVGDETKEIAFFSLEHLPKNLFFLHKEWIQDALKNQTTVILRPLDHITYWNLTKYFLKHPFWVLRFFVTMISKK